MKSRIDKAIEYIRGYCDKHTDCEKCRLHDDEVGCFLHNSIPAEWKTPSEMRKQ